MYNNNIIINIIVFIC